MSRGRACDERSRLSTLKHLCLHSIFQSKVGLPDPRAKGEQGHRALDLENGTVPFCLIEVLVECLASLLECAAIAFDVKMFEVGAHNNHGHGVDGIPVIIRNQVPVLVLNGFWHARLIHVGVVDTYGGVLHGLTPGPDEVGTIALGVGDAQ